jgi:hypothetical protein
MAHGLTSVPASARTKIAPDELDTAAIREARIDLAACFRMAAKLGMHEGVCNHLSAVLPGRDDLFFVNPYGYAFDEITASKLLVCDMHGNVVLGDGVPEITAFYIHARVHLRQPRIKVAFHTHMPNATALAMLEGPPLLWAGQTALKFYGRGRRSHRRRNRRRRHRIPEEPRRDGGGRNDRRSVGRPLLSRTRMRSATARTLDGQAAENRRSRHRRKNLPADAGWRAG